MQVNIMKHWWNDSDREKSRDIRINRIPILLCPPKVAHELAWDRTRVSEMIGCMVLNMVEEFQRRRSALFKGSVRAFVGTSRELRKNTVRMADSPFFCIPDAINFSLLLAVLRELRNSSSTSSDN